MKNWFIATEAETGKIIAKTYDVSELIKWLLSYMEEYDLTAIDVEIRRIINE